MLPPTSAPTRQHRAISYCRQLTIASYRVGTRKARKVLFGSKLVIGGDITGRGRRRCLPRPIRAKFGVTPVLMIRRTERMATVGPGGRHLPADGVPRRSGVTATATASRRQLTVATPWLEQYPARLDSYNIRQIRPVTPHPNTISRRRSCRRIVRSSTSMTDDTLPVKTSRPRDSEKPSRHRRVSPPARRPLRIRVRAAPSPAPSASRYIACNSRQSRADVILGRQLTPAAGDRRLVNATTVLAEAARQRVGEACRGSSARSQSHAQPRMTDRIRGPVE